MCQHQEMRGRLFVRFSGLWLLAIVLSCSPRNNLVEAEPEPVPPGLIYSDSYVDDAESFLLLQRLRQIAGRKHEALEQARELENEKMVIQSMLEEEEARRNQRVQQSTQNDYSAEDVEMLPIPSAIVHHGPVHSGKRTSSLRVCIKGAARVDWTESSGSGKDCRDDRYTANEEYFRLEYCILGGLGNSENLNIEAGYHEYPFNFCLPQNIPSSFECNHGSVRYTIKAVMDRPWKFDHQTTVSFAVETPYYLTECQSEMDTIEDEEVKSFCCFPCMNMGSMRVQIHMPTAGFAIGEAIEARVSIENNSRTVDVTKVKLQLEQKVKLYSRFPYSKTRRQNHVVQETKNVGPFHKKVQIPMCMQVPAVPQTNLTHCSIIDVHYRLAFKISVSGCHCATWKYYPIVIGTRTTPNLQPTQNTYSMPEFGESSSHFGPMESNVPSAPIDGTPSPSDRISIPLPITNQTFTNPGVTVFPIPTANQSYPPSMPGLFTTSGFQYPRPLNANIGFVDPNSMRTATSTEYPECPPPSYEAVMRAAENK